LRSEVADEGVVLPRGDFIELADAGREVILVGVSSLDPREAPEGFGVVLIRGGFGRDFVGDERLVLYFVGPGTFSGHNCGPLEAMVQYGNCVVKSVLIFARSRKGLAFDMSGPGRNGGSKARGQK
jgi:hypothetical protein